MEVVEDEVATWDEFAFAMQVDVLAQPRRHLEGIHLAVQHSHSRCLNEHASMACKVEHDRVGAFDAKSRSNGKGEREVSSKPTKVAGHSRCLLIPSTRSRSFRPPFPQMLQLQKGPIFADHKIQDLLLIEPFINSYRAIYVFPKAKSDMI